MKPSNIIYSPNVTLEQIEREYIERAIDYHNGNKRKAAQALGVTFKTLYNKLDRYSGAFKYSSNWKLRPPQLPTDIPQLIKGQA